MRLAHPSNPTFPATALRVALAALLVLGCSRKDADDSDDGDDPDAEITGVDSRPPRVVGKPFELNESLVARTGNALRDLRTAWLKQTANDATKSAMTVGPGIGYSVTNAADVVRPHGFARVEDFEQSLRHVQLALSVIVARDSFGSQHRDFDGGSLRKKLIDELDAVKKARDSTERDQTLSVDDRQIRVLELTEDIDGLQQRIDELEAISGNFGPERAHVPEGNVECVRKVRDALLPLFLPIQP